MSGGGIVALLLVGVFVRVLSGGGVSGDMMSGGILSVLGALSILLFRVPTVALIAALVMFASQVPRR